ncbi:hypothetical protein AUC61_13960 [Pseudomonas sp. S25]|uniref:Tyr recombinase domain-containing protein n=1 Tax=Pseudomonas maioricensis TaxID=1766623 RepID=A0ABS9ZJ79_9PSED|nr:hypothetical protein [Pseudomonas sp. S25]
MRTHDQHGAEWGSAKRTGERPTFHEIRALGAWLYEQQKFPQEYIQALLGHADEKMTRHYQEGHDEKKIEYVEVGAKLAF